MAALTALTISLLGFISPRAGPGVGGLSRAAAPRQAVALSSGFGTKKIVGKGAPGKSKPGAYEKLQQKSGLPEYSVFVRADEGVDWRSAGVLCVPRTASVSEAVAKAIYSRENELCAAVAKLHRDLAGLAVAGGTLQFGFRSSEFEADPIVMVTREMGADKKNFLQKVGRLARSPREPSARAPPPAAGAAVRSAPHALPSRGPRAPRRSSSRTSTTRSTPRTSERLSPELAAAASPLRRRSRAL